MLKLLSFLPASWAPASQLKRSTPVSLLTLPPVGAVMWRFLGKTVEEYHISFQGEQKPTLEMQLVYGYTCPLVFIHMYVLCVCCRTMELNNVFDSTNYSIEAVPRGRENKFGQWA